MQQWIRDNTHRLIRFEPIIEMEHPNPPVLQDMGYPIRNAIPSCIRLPETNGISFELRPQYINMLPKFLGNETEDAYIFISEFEEVCIMIKMRELNEDAVKLRFIPFALKDKAKKWLYSLPTNSISTWDEFVTVFLKKFFPIHKTVKLRNSIQNFKIIPGEPFWKYFDRFKDLLIQCPHHGLEKWRLCQIIYEGLDYSVKTSLESMCHGDFTRKNADEAWEFLESLSEKIMQ